MSIIRIPIVAAVVLLLGASICDCACAGLVIGSEAEAEFAANECCMELPNKQKDDIPCVHTASDFDVVSLTLDGGQGPMPAMHRLQIFILDASIDRCSLTDIVSDQAHPPPPDHVPLS